MHAGSANYDDLIQQARMGFLQALDRFDANKGTLGSYVRPWVEGAIKAGFAPADREQSNLDVEKLMDLGGGDDADSADDADLALSADSAHYTPLAEFVGGRDSGRDAYLIHPAASDAEVRERLTAWLAEHRGWTLDGRAWDYLRRAEPAYLAQARRGEDDGLAGLEQKYSLLRDKFNLDERSHGARELRLAPDRRSAALAQVVALAVEKGTLADLSWRASQPAVVAPGFTEVTAFRARYLAGKLIAAEEVVAWVQEQARREGPPAAAYVRVPLAAEELENFAELALAASPAAYAAWLAGRASAARNASDSELSQAHLSWPQALFYGSSSAPQIVRIRPDGTLAQLQFVVSNLRAHVDGWGEEEAVAFVLAGVVPPLDKLRASTRRGLYTAASRIILDCDPRTAPADVAAFYERLRARWLKGRDRVMTDKGLALALFTEQQWRPGRPWSELQQLWNSEHARGDPLHSAVSRNQFATESRAAWERLTGELWPGGKRAKGKLAADVAAARQRNRSRRSSLPL